MNNERALDQSIAKADVTMGKGRSPALMLIFYCVVCLTLALLAGKIASFVIPSAGALVAYLLYRRWPIVYVQFVWWLFFLSCFVRRLSDFQGGYSEQNLILATPLLAALVCAPTLIHKREVWSSFIGLPFLLAFASTLYGAAVAFLCLPKKTLPTFILGWFAPLVFGFFVLTECIAEETRLQYMKALQRTFVGGVLVMGLYGVYQYVGAPPWDMLWMSNAEMGSIGSPEAFAIRVFSTMNGPGPLAYALVAGLLLCLAKKGWLAAIAGIAGFSALLLSSVRAAWAALIIAVILFLFRQRQYISRILIAGVLFAVLAVVGIALSPAGEGMQDRLQSFTSLQDDTSYQQRTSGYTEMLPYALESPFGSGIGTMDTKFQDSTSLGTRDSGFWEVLLSLGWVGGLIYFAALGLLIVQSWPRRGASATATATSCICIAMLCQIVLGSVTIGVTGVEIWTFGAIAMGQFGLRSLPLRKGRQWLPRPAAV